MYLVMVGSAEKPHNNIIFSMTGEWTVKLLFLSSLVVTGSVASTNTDAGLSVFY
jgi:hypothetical protein